MFIDILIDISIDILTGKEGGGGGRKEGVDFSLKSNNPTLEGGEIDILQCISHVLLLTSEISSFHLQIPPQFPQQPPPTCWNSASSEVIATTAPHANPNNMLVYLKSPRRRRDKKHKQNQQNTDPIIIIIFFGAEHRQNKPTHGIH